ncbi:MAG TPA: hypothetical protein PKN70_11000 [Smithellaceae bacterium]|nr:hypothetical protein [Smithellaceae bacterium]
MTDFKRRFIQRLLGSLERTLETQSVLQCLQAAKVNRGLMRLRELADTEFRGFSQWGEDGIIDWLIERLPGLPRTFVEFGVENYRESNTRLLLFLRNWRGLVMDGTAECISDIQRQDIYWRYELTAKCAFIDRDNVNELIETAGFRGDIGLLSIDIDGNDYWVWQAITVVSPVIVVCEYNAVFGDRFQLTVPYRADFQRTHAHHSNLYFGGSLPAIVKLGEEKGYTFVGTTSAGCNAFFIRDDFAPKILSVLDNISAYPSFLRESLDLKGSLTFVGGAQRQKLIQDLPLVDLMTHRTTTLAECGEIDSPEWARHLNTSIQVSEAMLKKVG